MPGDATAVRAQCIRLIVAAIVTTVPDADPAVVVAVVTRACHPRGPARQIAADLFDEPSVLITGSSHSVRATQQLTNALADAGVPGVVRPRCGECGRSRLFKARLPSGQMACDECWKETRQEPCACCGQPAFVSFRGSVSGQGVCGACRARPACLRWCDDQERMAAEAGPIRPVVRNPHGDGDSTCRMCRRVRHPLDLVDDLYFLCGTCTRTYRSLARQAYPHRQSRFRRGQAVVRHEPTYCDECDQWKTTGGVTDTGAVLCGACWRNRAYPPCVDCGSKLRPGGHDQDGAPVCKVCWYRRDLAARPRAIPKPRVAPVARQCIRCGWTSRALEDGPHGPACYGCVDYVRRTVDELGVGPEAVTIGLAPGDTLNGNICDRCGRTVKAISTRRTGERICKVCAMKPQRICADCGHPRLHNPNAPGACPRCSSTTTTACRRCARNLFALLPNPAQPRCLFCRARQWIRARLGDNPSKPIDPRLDPLIDRLAATDDFPQLRQWLQRSSIAADALTRMARGHIPISHEALDAAAGALGGRAIGVQHLRRLMVSCGVLPPRAEYLARLEAALSRTIQDTPVADQLVIARYIHWHVLPGVRRRLQAGRGEERTCTLARRMLHAPIRLTDHLHALDSSVAALSQPVLDVWLSQRRADAIPLSVFLRWARRNRLAPALILPVQRMNDPMDFNDPDQQWQLLHRCLHDDTLSYRVRLAGALVLMYGQSASSIVRLRASHVAPGPPTTLHLGTDAVEVAEPLATLLRQAANGAIRTLQERGTAETFGDSADRWLFPGRGPGKPLGPEALLSDLRKTGIRSRHARNTTLLTLARELPPAVLADLLGIGTSTADRWRQWAGGTWASYQP
ncbi:MAG: hypothetical protein L0H26_02165 [Microlunatus sp.]|nr:hypothetical protein [Microlunatus sp.]